MPPAATSESTLEQHEQLRGRLQSDDVFYAKSCLKIVDQREQTVALDPKPAQLRLAQIKAKQEAEGKPVRIIVLKARKEGISTMVQGMMIKRVTQRRNHKALVVAHDGKTSGELFSIGETMYSELPDEIIAAHTADGGLALKPPVAGSRKGQEIRLGEPSRRRRLEGHRGLNSTYLVDTANEYESYRGFTFHSLHLSELGFYASPEKKLKSLLNTMPEEPGTMVVIESTANGYNLFRRLWVAAVSGNSDYYALFIAWYEDPDYWRPFPSEEARDSFIAEIGTGEYGEEEPGLVELGVKPEQLYWRRWAIANRCHGDLRTFWQEYPADWEQAFLATGRQVFAPVLVSKVLESTETTDPQAERGLIKPGSFEQGVYMGRTVEIPREPLWTPESTAKIAIATPLWRRWAPPDLGDYALEQPPGQYAIYVDSASGVETVSEGSDYFSIQIVNHRTLEQVAEWHARGIDADVVAQEVYLAAQLYTVQAGDTKWLPWVAVEITGGYGQSIASKLWRVWKYPMLYFRRPAEQKGEKLERRLGWSTDQKTKPLIVDHAKELLRLGRHGIRSKALAGEMQTFVKDEKGKMGAEEDYFDDRLIAWMGAVYIAQEKPLRRLKTAADSGAMVRAPSMHIRPHSRR